MIRSGLFSRHFYHSPILVDRVDALVAGLPVRRVQSAAVSVEVEQLDALAEHVEELVHLVAVRGVAEQLLLARLPVLLVDDAELVPVRDHVLVVVENQVGAA